MRVIFQDDPSNQANHGYIISHVGLNNDANWRDFRDFDLEDQEVFRKWLESQPQVESGVGNESTGSGKPRRFTEGSSRQNVRRSSTRNASLTSKTSTSGAQAFV